MFNLDDSFFIPSFIHLHPLQTAQCLLCLFTDHLPLQTAQCQAAYSHFVRRGVLDDLRTEVGAMNGASVQMVQVQRSAASNATGGGVIF